MLEHRLRININVLKQFSNYCLSKYSVLQDRRLQSARTVSTGSLKDTGAYQTVGETCVATPRRQQTTVHCAVEL